MSTTRQCVAASLLSLGISLAINFHEASRPLAMLGYLFVGVYVAVAAGGRK
jgi:hypothetical protein